MANILDKDKQANQKPRKVGRPRLPKGKARGKIVPVRLSDAEAAMFSKAAQRKNQSLSEWIRSTLNAESNC